MGAFQTHPHPCVVHVTTVSLEHCCGADTCCEDCLRTLSPASKTSVVRSVGGVGDGLEGGRALRRAPAVRSTGCCVRDGSLNSPETSTSLHVN